MIFGSLMHTSGLMPRRLALFGLVGGPLVCLSGIAPTPSWSSPAPDSSA
jgi:hypothetical protein